MNEKRKIWVIKMIRDTMGMIHKMANELLEVKDKLNKIQSYVYGEDKDEPEYICTGCGSVWNEYISCCPDHKKQKKMEENHISIRKSEDYP